MRSRMWLGGENVSLGYQTSLLFKLMNLILGQFSRVMTPNPADLLVHNAQEMSHLASFLPQLYATFHEGAAPACEPARTSKPNKTAEGVQA